MPGLRVEKVPSDRRNKDMADLGQVFTKGKERLRSNSIFSGLPSTATANGKNPSVIRIKQS